MRKLLTIGLLLGMTTPAIDSAEVTDVIQNALSTVVTIAVYKTQNAYRMLGFEERKTRGVDVEAAYKNLLDISGAQGSGSGFVINKNGKMTIVTNAHVVQMAAEEPHSIYAFSIDGTKYEARILGGDSFYDIAVLEFVDAPGKEISTTEFRTTEAKIGEPVYAIGTPLGKYPYSVSDGIISGLNRLREGITGKFGFIQTSATVTWGNSGGPLIDANGKVVGINSQIEIYADDQREIIFPQLNFALESRLSNKLVDDIINNHGFVKRAYLGLELSQTFAYDQQMRTFRPNDEAPILAGVIDGSPAATILKSSLSAEILAINDTNVKNLEEALGEFEKIIPGNKIELRLKKRGDEQTKSISTAELSPSLLTSIGKFIISKNNSVRFINAEDGIYCQIPKNTGQFRVLAAGIVFDKNNQQIWMVRNLKDLAAAFRFSGLYGTLDFYFSADETLHDIRLFKNSFSEDKYHVKSVLWY